MSDDEPLLRDAVSPVQAAAPQTAAAGLVSLLIDDAAVFPPGLAPLPSAVTAHRRIQRSGLSDWIGPLLVPAGRHSDLLPLVGHLLSDEVPLTEAPRGEAPLAKKPLDETPLEAAQGDRTQLLGIVLIAPATDPLTALQTALTSLAGVPGVSVTGVEMPLPPGTIDPGPTIAALDAMLAPGMGAALEFDSADPAAVLTALARARSQSHRLLRGKFRTGGTTTTSTPDADTLAAVIVGAVTSNMPIKFTAGLHHAVTGPHGVGGSLQYGVLNVLQAVQSAIAGNGPDDGASDGAQAVSGVGAGASEGDDARVRTGKDAIIRQLLSTDGSRLATAVHGWSANDIAAVRSIFTSFGCCGVTEPLTELAELGVIDPWEEL